MIAYAYLHGFASSPAAKKGVHLRDVFAPEGVELLLPDLNAPSFERLSVRAMLARLDALHVERGSPRWRIVGSSLGGWLAARWASLHPERVERLVLLCPAFDIARRWPHLMEEGRFEEWRRRGEIETKDGQGRDVALHFGFYEEASLEPAFPVVRCPTTIVHGTLDDRVPIESSERYVADHPEVPLVRVEDGHDLVASLPVIERVVRERFDLPGRTR